MNKILLAVLAVAVSSGVVNAFDLEMVGAKDFVNMEQTGQIVVPAAQPSREAVGAAQDRQDLVNAIFELSKSLEVCTDENQKYEIRIKIRELSKKLDMVIVAELNSNHLQPAGTKTAESISYQSTSEDDNGLYGINEIISRANLVNAIFELSKSLEVCTDENQKYEIRIKIRELSKKLDIVIVAELNSGVSQK